MPAPALERLVSPRALVAGLSLDAPRIMGILNVTPDSFSDGGKFAGASAALAQAKALVEAGADVLDIGGESTRPGAAEIPAELEIARTVPVLEAIRAAGLKVPISIDTRKAAVARSALQAGANIINDVSGFQFDPDLASVAAETGTPVILMHSAGTPDTMQNDPRYDNALLDIYDALEAAVQAAEVAGIPRDRVLVDPGIGFGKRDPHNLALLQRLSLFHSLGCGILLGVSRKGFIGRITGIEQATARDAPSAAVGLWAAGQGIQMLRVHDVGVQAGMIALSQAISAAGYED